MTATPPRWAEAILRVLLPQDQFENVSGDLLEEYRSAIYPARGKRGADVWYLKQVLGFVSRSARGWAIGFSAAFLVRTALDWFLPPPDFLSRSMVSTMLGSAILVSAGLYASWRSGFVIAGTVVGAAATAIAAVISIAGAAALFTIWHDDVTMTAIRGSGGLGEVFVLPVMLIVPGALAGTIGGLLGATIKKLQSA